MKRKVARFVKNNYNKYYSKYYFYVQTYSYEKRYKKIDEKLFKNSLDKDTIQKYKQKWGAFGKTVEINTFLMCYNLSGIIDFNIIPENIFSGIIQRKLNPNVEISFFEVKNIYNKWFKNKEVFPKDYLHKIDGLFYDAELNIISDLNKHLNNIEITYPLILKPSRDTYGGAGVKVINNMNELLEGFKKYDYLVCQEMLVQHKDLDRINKGVNSVRSCLYKTKSGKFEILNNTIRFGIDGGLDNETAGGIVCNIHEGGILNGYALDKYANKFSHHPNSNVEFKKVTIPFYEDMIVTAKKIADELILCDLVSIDLCLDNNNRWRCLETNLYNQTIRFAQYAGKGFFGEYTDEVIEKVVNQIK